MNKKLKITLSILAILFGAFLVVYGGYDDSPGAQGLGLIAVIFGISLILKRGEAHQYHYHRKQFLVSRAEHECYDALVTAVGHEYRIFAQVHLPTIVTHVVKGQNWRAAFAHINQKSVDFVLCDKVYLSPKLVIELDDASHDQPSRQKRDHEVERILLEAGVPLLRLENQGKFETNDLARRVIEALQPPKPGGNS